MSRIAGIIYPSSLHTTRLTLPTVSFRYKNLEIGVCKASVYSHEKKNISIFLDGELENSRQLREELKEKHGFFFETQTDEELILHAYEAWKEKCIQYFKGSFALVIFDRQREQLFVVRDPLGQKVIYWTTQGNYWLFATNIKTLLSTGVVPQTPSNDALSAYLYFGYIPQDLSAIHNVYKLLPGHLLKINLRQQIVIEQYWSLSEQHISKTQLPYDEILKRLQSHINKALVFSVDQEKMGTVLFSNLGSRALNFFLKEHISLDRLISYTSFFRESRSPELEASAQFSKQMSLQHIFKSISPEDVFRELITIVWHLEEPLADPHVVCTWQIAKLASSTCRTIFTEIGWEELFGAVNPADPTTQFKEKSITFLLAQTSPIFRKKLLFPVLNFLRSDYKYKILRQIEQETSTELIMSPLFNNHERQKVTPFLYRAFDPEIFSQRFHKLSFAGNAYAQSLYFDLKTKIPDSSLFQYEKLFSAYKIKAAHPYLNSDLISFLATLSDDVKFPKNYRASLLQNLLSDTDAFPLYLKREGSFLDSWRKNGSFRVLFKSLAEGQLVEAGLISQKWCRQQLQYPYLIPENFRKLWSLLILEIWFRIFINQPMSDSPPTSSLEFLLSK